MCMPAIFEKLKKDAYELNMLSGPLVRPMLAFALPLIATGVLQQSFNSVDVAVAGRFAGSTALAAVGVNGPVLGLLVNLFLGLSVGVNVVIANYIGSGDRHRAAKAVGTSTFLAVVCGILMMGITLAVAAPVHRLLGTPAEVFDQAVAYLRILAAGMPFMLLYNFCAAALRSIGDTTRPFFILVVAGLVNVVLNLFFVAVLDMGAQGVAWGTVISNIVSCAMICAILLRSKGDVRLQPALVGAHRRELGKIARIGLPAGLQGTVFSASNVFIMSAINSFGAIAAAGSAAGINFEFYTYFVMTGFIQTAVAFAGQNYGAGQIDRALRVCRLSILMSMVFCGLLGVVLVIFRHDILLIFSTDSQVLVYAGIRVATVLGFQFIASYYEIAGGVMRAFGYSMTPTLIIIFGTCALRLLWVGIFPADGTFTGLMAVYPVSWALTDVMMFAAFRYVLHRIRSK